MAGKDIEKALMAVEPVTKAAKIRQVMPVIEKQLRAGVRRQAILDVLKEQGIEVSMDTLKSYLYRYRKAQRGNQANTASPAPAPQHLEPARQVEPEQEGGVYPKGPLTRAFVIVRPAGMATRRSVHHRRESPAQACPIPALRTSGTGT